MLAKTRGTLTICFVVFGFLTQARVNTVYWNLLVKLIKKTVCKNSFLNVALVNKNKSHNSNKYLFLLTCMFFRVIVQNVDRAL